MKSFSWGKIRLPRKFHCPQSLWSAQKFVVVCKPTLVFTLFLSVEPNNICSALISIHIINYSKYFIISKPGSPCKKRWIFCPPKRYFRVQPIVHSGEVKPRTEGRHQATFFQKKTLSPLGLIVTEVYSAWLIIWN